MAQCVNSYEPRWPHLALEGVDDELQGLRLDTLDALLHDMVAILVLHTLEHVAIQLTHDVALSGQAERVRVNVR